MATQENALNGLPESCFLPPCLGGGAGVNATTGGIGDSTSGYSLAPLAGWGAALSGQTKTRVLGTTQAGIVSSARFDLQETSGYYAQVDDVVMTVADPVTTSYQYNNANDIEHTGCAARRMRIPAGTGKDSAGRATKQIASRTFVRQGGQAVRARARHVVTCRAWGRLVTKNQGSYQARYGYRFGDKLKDVASNFPGEAATVYYNYDGFGKRRCKTLDLVSCTWWRWDLGWNPIQEYADPDADWDMENLALTYIPGLAEVPGTNPATGSYRYYMGDHLGSVRTLRDQNKTAIASYEYMPYGEIYNQTGLALNKGFTGHTWDRDDGLYYAPYRYYNPVASRWLTRDPLEMIDGPNLYFYTLCDPINHTDPTGLTYCRRGYPYYAHKDDDCDGGYHWHRCLFFCEDICDKRFSSRVRSCFIRYGILGNWIKYGQCVKKAESRQKLCYISCSSEGKPHEHPQPQIMGIEK